MLPFMMRLAPILLLSFRFSGAVAKDSLANFLQRALEPFGSDGVSDLCIHQTQQVQKELGISDPFEAPPLDKMPDDERHFLPLFNDQEEFFYARSKCRSKGSNSMFCNLQSYLFDFAPQCFALGGMPVPLNLKATCPLSLEIKYKNIPFCVGHSCNKDLFDLMNSTVNNSVLIGQSECSLALTVNQETGKCFENSKNTFTVDFNGQTSSQKCNWLRKRPFEVRRELCGKYEGVRINCPQTCCLCANEKSVRFLKKVHYDAVHDGEVVNQVPVTKSCAWLGRQSQKVQNRHCSSKKIVDSVQGFESAWKQCPMTCGLCPVPK